LENTVHILKRKLKTLSNSTNFDHLRIVQENADLIDEIYEIRDQVKALRQVRHHLYRSNLDTRLNRPHNTQTDCPPLIEWDQKGAEKVLQVQQKEIAALREQIEQSSSVYNEGLMKECDGQQGHSGTTLI